MNHLGIEDHVFAWKEMSDKIKLGLIEIQRFNEALDYLRPKNKEVFISLVPVLSQIIFLNPSDISRVRLIKERLSDIK